MRSGALPPRRAEADPRVDVLRLLDPPCRQRRLVDSEQRVLVTTQTSPIAGGLRERVESRHEVSGRSDRPVRRRARTHVTACTARGSTGVKARHLHARPQDRSKIDAAASSREGEEGRGLRRPNAWAFWRGKCWSGGFRVVYPVRRSAGPELRCREKTQSAP